MVVGVARFFTAASNTVAGARANAPLILQPTAPLMWQECLSHVFNKIGDRAYGVPGVNIEVQALVCVTRRIFHFCENVRGSEAGI